MTIEEMLSLDFAALTRRLNADDFVKRTLERLHGVERMRLVVIGGAGAAGAAIAASQFGALTGAIRDSIPMLATVPIADGAVPLDIGAVPLLMAALLFAAVGGATALIAPGSR